MQRSWLRNSQKFSEYVSKIFNNYANVLDDNKIYISECDTVTRWKFASPFFQIFPTFFKFPGTGSSWRWHLIYCVIIPLYRVLSVPNHANTNDIWELRSPVPLHPTKNLIVKLLVHVLHIRGSLDVMNEGLWQHNQHRLANGADMLCTTLISKSWRIGG